MGNNFPRNYSVQHYLVCPRRRFETMCLDFEWKSYQCQKFSPSKRKPMFPEETHTLASGV